MLDELLEFKQIPKKPPKIKNSNLKKVSSNPNIHQNNIIINNPAENITFQEEEPTNKNNKPTLAEKVLLRQKKEEEKKRKAEIYKELHKNKKMNLHQFLSRVQNYEQKKKYNLELKKYKQLQKETESIQDKPKLSHNTLKICKTMPKQPLYKRTDQVMEDHKQEIKNLTIFYTMPREVRERDTIENNANKDNKNNKSNINKNKNKKKYYSAEVTRNNNNNDDVYNSLQSIESKNINITIPKKMTKQQSDEFFNKQEKWLKNKRARNQYFEKFYQIQNDTYSNVTFRPYVSQASLEILDIKNKLNTNNDECYKYHIPNSYSQYNNLILNKGRTIWDKLYEEAGQKKNCYEEQLIKELIPVRRKSTKFKNISSKYFNVYLYDGKNKNKRNKNNSFYKNNLEKSKAKGSNKSFDNKSSLSNLMELSNINSTGHFGNKKDNKKKSYYEHNDNDIKEYNYYKLKKEREKNNWRNSLLKMKPFSSEPTDTTYHLNIMQSGAWNDNLVNKITLDGNTKGKSVIKLII